MAKYRYKTRAVQARLYHIDKGVEVRFEDAADAITPGQSVVWYEGEDIVGGGISHMQHILPLLIIIKSQKK